MRKETYYCDECGAERKQANHWFIAHGSYVAAGTNQLAQSSRQVNGVFLLEPWREDSGGLHLCGQVCVVKALDRFMSTGKLEK